MFYELAPTKIFRAGSDLLTYHSDKALKIGQIVTVPVGKVVFPAVVIKKVSKPDFETKEIHSILYENALPPHLVKAALWLKKYYQTPLATIFQAILPSGITKTRRQKAFQNPSTPQNAKLPLNPAQQKAAQQILDTKSNTVLLHGITGSGKTNVYIKLAQQVLSQNQSIILLVPEIALTSQLIMNFQTYFPNISILHSKQSEAKRHLLWENILKNQQAQIIIGPRSAIFAPVQNLGLIIIDEAHDAAYYQEQNPKYSALRLASTMAKTVLGSATPSVLDYYLCQQNHSIIELNQLAKQSEKTADIQIIDLKKRENFTKHRLFSNQLLESITASLSHHQQSLIFHNRRGSAPLTICEKCGWQALCPKCLLPLNLHNDKFELICHSCGLHAKVPTSCPNCKNSNIIHKGFGTKLIESELNKIFPNASIARFDADTPDDKSLKNLYQQILSGDIDIIIGTQMIAKGFDFPLLSTLGVVQADAGLSLPDFASEERSFQLITQVIGRAKRGHQNSQIFIQSYQPEHPAIKFGADSDYLPFYNYLLAHHKKANFPPFSFLLKLQVSFKTEAATVKNINSLYLQLKQSFPETNISRPTPSFHERKNQGYYWQIIVKSKSRQKLLTIASQVPQSTHFRISLDPISLL